LWIGTYQGLALHRAGQTDTVLAPWSVFSLSADDDGGVWVGYEGLRRLEASGAQPAPELPAIKVFGSVVSGEDVWVASEDQGVRLLSDGRFIAVPGYPTADTYSLTLSPYGPWAAAGRQGLAGPNGLRITRLDGLPSSTAWAVASQGTGLWVGTNAGLSWVQLDEDGSAREIRSPRLSRWPADRSASALLLREDGAFVAGDYGVWSIGMPHDDAADLIVAADPPVLSLLAVADDVWAIGRSAVRLNADGDLHRVGLSKRPDAAASWAGTVWIGDERGLFRYEAQRDDFVQMAELPDVSVLASDEHALWAVGKGGVVFRVVFGAVRPYAQTQHALALSSDGEQVCVGTLNGLERLRVSDGAVTDLLEGRDEGVAIPAVAHDGSGGCWFAAEDGTVGRIRSDGSIASSQLPDDAWPTAMVTDGADAAWVLTERGSWRVRL
jgi:ligand-binding sensor domain-containing protein